MSTDTGPNGVSESQTTIILTKEDEWWVGTDQETGVVSQGRTRSEALTNLDEAVAGYEGAGRDPTDEELHHIGIDSATNVSGKPLPEEFQ